MLAGYSQAHLRFSVSVYVCHCNWEKVPHGLLSPCLPCQGCWTGNVHTACSFHYVSLSSLMFGTGQDIPVASQGWAFPLGKLALSVLSTANSRNSCFKIHDHFCSWCIELKLSRASSKKCLGNTSVLSVIDLQQGCGYSRNIRWQLPVDPGAFQQPGPVMCFLWGHLLFHLFFFCCFDRYKLP